MKELLRSRAFWILIGVALVVRIAFVLATRDLELLADTADYHRLATSVSDGDGFGRTVLAAGGGPTAFRAPLFPAALGALYAVVGPRVVVARLVLGVLGVVTVALIGLLAVRLFGRRTALVATAIAAVYPPLLLANGTLITESVFLPLQLGALNLGVRFLDAERARERRAWAWLVGAGLLAGLTALSRQAGLVLVAGLVALLLFRRGPATLRSRLVAPVLLGVVAVATVAPWTARNIVTMDYPFIVSNDDGFVFAGVFNDQARNDGERSGIWRPPTAVEEHEALFTDPGLDETELALELRSRGLAYAADHPSYAAYVAVQSARALFEVLGFDASREAAAFLGYGQRTADVATLAWFLAASLAVVGAFGRAVRRAPWALWLTPLAFTVITVIVLGTPRYRAPIEPFVVIVAALGIDAVIRRVRGARTTDTATA